MNSQEIVQDVDNEIALLGGGIIEDRHYYLDEDLEDLEISEEHLIKFLEKNKQAVINLYIKINYLDFKKAEEEDFKPKRYMPMGISLAYASMLYSRHKNNKKVLNRKYRIYERSSIELLCDRQRAEIPIIDN